MENTDNSIDFSRENVEEVQELERNDSTENVIEEIILPEIPVVEIDYEGELPDNQFIFPKKILRDQFRFKAAMLKSMVQMSLVSQAMFLIFRECFKISEIQRLGQSIATVDPTISNNADYKETLFLDLDPSELENYLKFDQDGADNPEIVRRVREMENLIKSYTQAYYLKYRTKLFVYHPEVIKGQDPDMLTMDEISVLETLVGKFFTSSSEIGKSLSNTSTLSGLDYTFRDMSVSTRKRLEVLKIGLINEQGYTEESVNKYIEACIDYTRKGFDEGKYNVREEAKYDVDGAKAAENLLVKDEEWHKHFEETGEKLQKYSTDMLNKIVEHDTKEIEDFVKEEGEQILNTKDGQLIKDMNAASKQTFKNGLEIMMATEGKYFGTANAGVSKSVDRSDKQLTYAEKRKAKRDRLLLKDRPDLLEDKSEVVVEEPKKVTQREDKFAKFKENLEKQNEERKEIKVEEKKEEVAVVKPVEEVKEVKVETPTTVKTKEVVVNTNPYAFDNKDLATAEIELKLKEAEIEKLRLQLELQKAKQTVVIKEEVKVEEVAPVVEDTKVETKDEELLKDVFTIAPAAEPAVYKDVEELNKEEIASKIKDDEEDESSSELMNMMKNMSPEEASKLIQDVLHKELERNGRNAYDEFPKLDVDPDPAILRMVSNPVQRIKAYRDSAKEGRRLFLPNSGYEVFIKKIRDRDQISFLLDLLDPNENLTTAVDQLILDECVNILYGNMEFDFDEHVSKEDFLKCIHPDDIIFAIMMFAIVNLPLDKDGKCLVKISSVSCNNEYHGPQRQIFTLKAPLTIDILEEFTKLYKVNEELLRRRSVYTNTKYESIYDAYEQNGAGINEYVSIPDDVVTYNIILSPVNLFKIGKEKEEAQKIMYDSILNDFRSTGSIKEKLQVKIGRDFDRVERYIENTTFELFKNDARRLSGFTTEDLEYTFPDVTDEKTRQELLRTQEADKEALICISHIIPLLAEYTQNLDYAMIMINFIESLEVISNDTKERIAGPISHDEYGELLQIFTQIPDIKAIGEGITKLSDRTNLVLENTMVEWNSKDIFKFMPTFEDIFAPRDRYKDTLEKEGVPEIEVEKYLIEYDKQKEHMHSGKCFCGSDKFVLDWRSILFQCLSKA